MSNYQTRAAIENAAYYSDFRNQPGNDMPTVILENDREVKLPTKWDVCPVCDGEGKHVNPAIDCNGLTAEDFAEDPDFYDEYMSGTYDVTCNRCNGRTTVRVIDWDSPEITPEVHEMYLRQEREAEEIRACQRAERMMGA